MTEVLYIFKFIDRGGHKLEVLALADDTLSLSIDTDYGGFSLKLDQAARERLVALTDGASGVLFINDPTGAGRILKVTPSQNRILAAGWNSTQSVGASIQLFEFEPGDLARLRDLLTEGSRAILENERQSRLRDLQQKRDALDREIADLKGDWGVANDGRP